MTNRVEMRFSVPDFGRMAQELRDNIPNLIAATLQTQRGMMFDLAGANNGHEAWLPLKYRKGSPLKDTGTLSQSIGPRNNGIVAGRGAGSIVRLSQQEVTIGTELPYAKIHDEGGTIKNHEIMIWRNKKSGRFQKYTNKRGNLEIHQSGEYQIPARPFSGINAEDEKEIAETVENYITEVWNKYGKN
jgi:phage gpG-like protein